MTARERGIKEDKRGIMCRAEKIVNAFFARPTSASDSANARARVFSIHRQIRERRPLRERRVCAKSRFGDFAPIRQ